MPTDDADALQKQITDFIATEIEPQLKAQSELAGVTTKTTNEVAPLLPDDKSPAEQLIRHLTGLNDSGVVSFGTEAGAFQQAGIPAVIFGPGSITQCSHCRRANLHENYRRPQRLKKLPYSGQRRTSPLK